MSKAILASLLAAALALTAQVGLAAGTDVPAAAKSCADCHGAGGVSTHEEVPTIAGMSAYYLEGQIEAYKNGDRPCPKTKYKSGDTSRAETDMCDIAKKLSKDDVTAVTEYFENQAFVPAKQTFDAAKAAEGKKLQNYDCEKCHSEGGSVADDDAGILAGQWKAYLKDTFADYKSGKRLAPEKMKPKIDKLTPDQIDALIEYFASEGAK